MKRSTRIILLVILIDFLLLCVAVLSMQAFKREITSVSPTYFKLFIVFFISWMLVSIGMKKFRGMLESSYYEGLILVGKSNLLMAFLISFAVVGLHLIPASRIQTFGTFVMFFLLEILGFSILHYKLGQTGLVKPHADIRKSVALKNISYSLLLVDGLLLLAAFFVMNYIKRGNFMMLPRYDQIFMIIAALWLPASVITFKFDRRNFADFYNSFFPCVKSAAIIAAILSMVVFAFRLFFVSRIQIFGTLLVFLIFEAGTFYLYYLYKEYGSSMVDLDTAEMVSAALEGEDLSSQDAEKVAEVVDPVGDKLEYALDFFSHGLFDFIRGNIDLMKIDRSDTSILSTDNLFNVQTIENNSLGLLINIHKLNDMRWLNRYFLETHGKIRNGMYLIGKAHTVETHRQYFVEKYPGPFLELLYGIDFIWRRIFPKLPYAKKIYFTLTQGRNRMISKAEIFGRLYFCGFRLIADIEIDNRLFFIAQKVKRPSLSLNPTYGPIVKLNRTGLTGKPLEVYKFRTMHPYSEFLQEYVYERNKLQKSGKFENDFRVATWGRYMREVWLDELPMLYNWLRGDMKLFGVRPLSSQYLSLYSPELRELRTKVKPGLIPPFFADLPETLPDIQKSEMRYIESYLKDPMKTQLSYLWRSFVNIVIKGARSN